MIKVLPTKILPKELTSYDLLKTFAIIFMIIDHVGFYVFPDETWLRVFGLCVPVWFFLIGYANSRDLGARMWIGAAIIACANMTVGLSLFPLNILFSMLLIRLILDGFMERALRTQSTFWAVNVVLFFLVLPAGMFFEYGTGGVILAMFGWLLRRKDDFKDRKDMVNNFFAFAAASFVVMQYIAFAFEQTQLLVLSLGCLLVMGTLYAFRPATLPRLTAVLPAPFVWLLKLTGRRTLEIYVIHIVLFDIYGLLSDPERFALWDVSLFYLGME